MSDIKKGKDKHKKEIRERRSQKERNVSTFILIILNYFLIYISLSFTSTFTVQKVDVINLSSSMFNFSDTL